VDEREQVVQVRLLGPFSISTGGRTAGPWPRPSARRLCARVLIAPGRRISRDLACEDLFPDLDPHAAARAVSKALSMARAALADLGEGVLFADLTHIWAASTVQIDAEAHEAALRAALAMGPGRERDDLLVGALAEDGELLADEPYTDWALRPRERLEALRQEARLTLARDRAKGAGQAAAAAVTQAWEACFEHDQACEEAAVALVLAYSGQGRRELAVRVYERCAAALDELGLRISPSLAEAFAAAATDATRPVTPREELRTVSVLFAEVAAPAGLGLETLRDTVGASLAAVIAEVEALGGTVTSVSGSGIQAMFGAPQAHEDDPERAVRAAFRALNAAEAGTLRIGVETGHALLGPIGAGGRVEYGAVGDVVRTAAALQAAARPGSALVGPVTRAATGHLFTWEPSDFTREPSDQREASYLGGPRATPAGRQFGLGRQAPLAGRQEEIRLLVGALRNLVRGRGSLIVLTGEPGLGKTRLVHECRKRFMAWANSQHLRPLWLEGRCTSYAAATPYGLYQQVVASWLHEAADEPEAVLRPALERALIAATGDTDLFAPLARMMCLSPGAALGRLSPAEQQRATFAALHSLIARLASDGPAVLVLEDLHWADPTSLRLTAHLAGLVAERPLLILATRRPDGLDLPALPAHQITLTPLPAEAERDLARSIVGNAVGTDVLDAVLTSTDGNPLFLEERLSSLVETGALVHDEGVWRLGEGARAEVPQVLERLVRSRVDRLSPEARDAVRAAAVIGVEFPLPLLTAVCADAGPPVMDELCARDLVRQVPGDHTFRFRHALIQEAIYDGLLTAERRLLHGRVAWTLEESSGEHPEIAAVLGTHFSLAGESERAVCYLQQAGDHATSAFANTEAISSYQRALAILRDQQAGTGGGSVAARVNAKLANVLWRTARRGEAREAFREGVRQADAADVPLRAHLLTRLGRLEMMDDRYEAAGAAFEAAQALLGEDPPAQDADDQTVDQWLELMLDGWADLYAVCGQQERSLATLRAAGPLLAARGNPPRRTSYYHVLGLARVMRNRYRVDETDLQNIRLSAAAAAGCDEEKDLAYATFFVGWLLLMHGDLAQAQVHLERSLAMAERIGEAVLLAESLIKLTFTALRRHDTETVRTLAQRAVAAADAMAAHGCPAEARASLAWLAWRDGRPQDVITLVDEITAAGAAGTYHVPNGVTPHRWVYLFPLIATQLDAADIAAAVAAARQLLDPAQPHLPDELDSVLTQACDAWDRAELRPCEALLKTALTLAQDLRYC
jgi:DNA-binding SARP family transcriptional activator/tetratricopeptide (TPR) repeat protein